MFMQQLWRDNYDWDDPLPTVLSSSIVEYIDSLRGISELTIPRWTEFSMDLSDVQLHGFSDASEKAYGAVVYLRAVTPSGQIIISILSSKTKVAPLKQLTIPRLELQAAVLLARLIVAICAARSLSQIKYQCWTDAGIVLTWLNQHASRWKTFIAHRVSEIHSLLPSSQWRYVPTETNPADILSRGKAVDELLNSSLWWDGPPWLSNSEDQWPLNLIHVSPGANLEEKQTTLMTHLTTPDFDQLSHLFERCSSWIKIIRVVATIWKYVQCLKAKVKNKPMKSKDLDAYDINVAEMHVIKYLQKLLFPQEVNDLQNNKTLSSKSRFVSLNPYLENDIIRVGGRLSRANLAMEAKHPIVLSSHPQSQLDLY